MKITLSLRETMRLKAIMGAIDENSVKELTKGLEESNLAKVNYDILAGNVTVEIDEEYVSEYLEVYEKYIDILVQQAKVLFKTSIMLQSETGKVVEKYVEKNTSNTSNETKEVKE